MVLKLPSPLLRLYLRMMLSLNNLFGKEDKLICLTLGKALATNFSSSMFS